MQNACFKHLATAQKPFYLATLVAPPQKRPALWAILNLHHEYERIFYGHSDITLARIRFLWWRETIEKAKKQKITPETSLETSQQIHSRAHPHPLISALISDKALLSLNENIWADFEQAWSQRLEADARLEKPADFNQFRTLVAPPFRILLNAWLELLSPDTPHPQKTIEMTTNTADLWAMLTSLQRFPHFMQSRKMPFPVDSLVNFPEKKPEKKLFADPLSWRFPVANIAEDIKTFAEEIAFPVDSNSALKPVRILPPLALTTLKQMKKCRYQPHHRKFGYLPLSAFFHLFFKSR